MLLLIIESQQVLLSVACATRCVLAAPPTHPCLPTLLGRCRRVWRRKQHTRLWVWGSLQFGVWGALQRPSIWPGVCAG